MINNSNIVQSAFFLIIVNGGLYPTILALVASNIISVAVTLLMCGKSHICHHKGRFYDDAHTIVELLPLLNLFLSFLPIIQ